MRGDIQVGGLIAGILTFFGMVSKAIKISKMEIRVVDQKSEAELVTIREELALVRAGAWDQMTERVSKVEAAVLEIREEISRLRHDGLQ